MARVLITGASGFIGRPALDQLITGGHEVHCLARNAGDVAGAIYHHVDLLGDGKTLAGLICEIKPQSLLHLAWSVEPGAFWQDRNNLDWLAASFRLYRAFVAAGGTRMVSAGSAAEYDWSLANTAQPLDETASALMPATLYGQTKKSLFDVLTPAAALDGVSLAAGRIFFLYGPGEKPGRVVSDVIVNLLQSRPVETTVGTQRLDFMHVDDVARAFVALLDSEASGAVNIASGQDLPLSQLLVEIGAQLDRTDLLQFGARPLAANDPSRLAASIARLRNEVGFAPTFDLQSGLADTIAWWRRNLPQDDAS